MSKYDYYTIQNKGNAEYPDWVAYGWGTYPSHSVLAGQPMKCYLKSFDSLTEARDAYPDAELSNEYLEPQVCLNHLSDEGDY